VHNGTGKRQPLLEAKRKLAGIDCELRLEVKAGHHALDGFTASRASEPVTPVSIPAPRAAHASCRGSPYRKLHLRSVVLLARNDVGLTDGMTPPTDHM
jgi:hypothetical protein